MIKVVEVNGGYAVDKHGELVYPTTGKKGSPFKTEESAWGFVKYMKFMGKDPAYQDADIPAQYLKKSSHAQEQKPSFKFVQHAAPSGETAAQVQQTSHETSDDCRPEAMSDHEHSQVQTLYRAITGKLTHNQLSALNTMLYRFDQDWSTKEQLALIKAKDESYLMRTSWAKADTPDTNDALPAEAPHTQAADDIDEMLKEVF